MTMTPFPCPVVVADHEIGHRTHPVTGQQLTYIACTSTAGLDARAAAPERGGALARPQPGRNGSPPGRGGVPLHRRLGRGAGVATRRHGAATEPRVDPIASLRERGCPPTPSATWCAAPRSGPDCRTRSGTARTACAPAAPPRP